MSTITLLIIEGLICFIGLVLMYKKFKIDGLYIYSITLSFLAAFMSLKQIPIDNYDINLGLIPFVMIFTTFNTVIQKKGVEETKKLLLTIVSTTLIGYIILLLISYATASNINLFTSASYDNIFTESIRMYFANIVTLLYSLLLNNKLYYYLKVMKNNIIISNIFSSIIIHFVASIIFGLISFIFITDMLDIIKVIMIRYLLSLLIAILSTIPIYITKFIKD